MVKTLAHGHAEQKAGIPADLLKKVFLESFLYLLDNKTSNDAFQVLLSRNELGVMRSRKAYIEVMQQWINLIVRHKLMLKFFGRFPSVGLPTALAILNGSVDIQVKVGTKAMEATQEYALHLKKPAEYDKPKNWPPSLADVEQLAGGSYDEYLFTNRQGQQGHGRPELFATCPGILAAVGKSVQLVRHSNMCVFGVFFFMGHAAGQSNQYYLPEELDSHEAISSKHDATRLSSTKRVVAAEQGSEENHDNGDDDAELEGIDKDLEAILDVASDAEAVAGSLNSTSLAATLKWRRAIPLGSLGALPNVRYVTFKMANAKEDKATEPPAKRRRKRVQKISVICTDLCQHCQNTCKHLRHDICTFTETEGCRGARLRVRFSQVRA